MSNFTEIEREAAVEREKLARSLNALSEAVAPANVKEHAAVVAEKYGGDLGQQAWGAAKQNPAAFALVGAGLSLLLTGTGSRPETKRPAPTAVPADDALVGFDERVAAADAEMKEEMTGMIDQPTAPRAAWLRAKLNDGLDALPAASRDRVLKARKAALSAQEQIEARARRTAAQSRTFMHAQPLAVGAVALGIGALIGALVPSTRREDELLGEHRNAVMSAAQQTLREELDKARDAAHSALKS